MLAKANRIVRGDDFRRIVRTGRRAGGPLAVVHRARPEAAVARFGFIVSKQVGNAVVRNRVKRRLSEIVRAELDRIEPADIVIRALPAAADADFATLRAGIAPLLERRS
ncbi:ribonuclease P protein component [Agrococcus sp. HG114]|uniref:ribonuclease P protein component n=1 Tax=Agrococcus sp. HG114 TaxID=2969757 RepID=UPI00215B49EC|nr:ribonuclease P protein component [Agrococcus sp. HG114]MCR8669738.1 ribonuclease P protein component [Agrococcus sp. HG114]